MSTLANETPVGDLFASFDIAELEVLEVSDSVGLPEMGASSSSLSVSAEAASDISLCCSSSSSTCCCC